MYDRLEAICINFAPSYIQWPQCLNTPYLRCLSAAEFSEEPIDVDQDVEDEPDEP